MPSSKVRYGNQNGIVIVRFASMVWRYDLAKIEKNTINKFGKILTKQKKFTFSTKNTRKRDFITRFEKYF